MSEVIMSCLKSNKRLPDDLQNYSHIFFTLPEFTVGRALSNAIVLTNITVSRTHCKFQKQPDNSWYIVDLSSFGSKLNGKDMQKHKQYTLKDNDLLQLDVAGDISYIFRQSCVHNKGSNAFKKQKLNNENINNENIEIINHTMQKFEDSQTFEVENMESKIKTAKLIRQHTNTERSHIEHVVQKEIEILNEKYMMKIQEIGSLKGRKDVEREKANINEQRITEIKLCKENMKLKILLLEEKISQQVKNEEKLQLENEKLSERLKQERYEFEKSLKEETNSKQGLLNNLETKLLELKSERIKEKDLLEEEKRKYEFLNATKDKELKELEEKLKMNIEVREMVIAKLQKEVEEKVSENEEVKVQKQEFENKLQEMQSATELLKMRMNQMGTVESEIQCLQAEKIKIENRLLENMATSSATVTQLETELSKVRSKLDKVELRKAVLEIDLETTKNQLAIEDLTGIEVRQNALTEMNLLMEAEFQCSICADMLIAATSLNCSHSFCKYCIEQWKKKKNECPICRAPITSQCRSIMLDSFINKMLENLGPDIREKRLQVLKDRDAEEIISTRPILPPTTGQRHRYQRRGQRNRRLDNPTRSRLVNSRPPQMPGSVPTVDLTSGPGMTDGLVVSMEPLIRIRPPIQLIDWNLFQVEQSQEPVQELPPGPNQQPPQGGLY